MKHIDVLYYSANGQTYGDLSYDPNEYTFRTTSEALAYIEAGLRYDGDDNPYRRTTDYPDPCVLSIIDGVTGGVEYVFANCSEAVANEYGIQANEYIETL